jgi:hypothetical protein
MAAGLNPTSAWDRLIHYRRQSTLGDLYPV